MLQETINRLDPFYTIKLTKEMIAIPSVTSDEEVLTHYIKDKLESYGMKTTLHTVAPNRPNIYATMQGQKPGKRLNYNAHTDTVPPGDNWTTDPFKA